MTYTEFKDKYLGKYVDWDGQYGSQCWDLAQMYFTECLGLPSSILNGCGLVSNMLKEPKLSLMKEFFDIIPLDQKKQGDVEIWNYGHIAIMDHWDNKQKVNYYLSQNPNPVEVIAIADNPQCMAFRKKINEKDLEKEIAELKIENQQLKDKIEQIKTIVN